jgi:hypothetical protein
MSYSTRSSRGTWGGKTYGTYKILAEILVINQPMTLNLHLQVLV